ncbi:uncharacterized protein [Asterias amurensis]|uniref:uncharacterized protein isoform X2 n=1 Tax=Asterias amurensis TaxID=7602 RepID=UPI003AB19456
MQVPLEEQLKNILPNSVIDGITNYRNSFPNKEDVIADALDGDLYKQQFDGMHFKGTDLEATQQEVHISLQMNMDGVSLFQSSSYAVWPLYCTINELPPALRFTRKYRLFSALWFGKHKPVMSVFLRVFCAQLLNLYEKDNNAARQLIINGLSDMGIDVPASAIDGAQIMMGGSSSNGLDITALSTSEDDEVDGTVQETPPKTKSSKPKGFQWPTSSVLALIDCFQSNKENFESSCIRKKTAWKMVAAMMVTKGCLDMTGSQCDEKWRSLKHRYKTICDSKAKTGRGKRKNGSCLMPWTTSCVEIQRLSRYHWCPACPHLGLESHHRSFQLSSWTEILVPYPHPKCHRPRISPTKTKKAPHQEIKAGNFQPGNLFHSSFKRKPSRSSTPL